MNGTTTDHITRTTQLPMHRIALLLLALLLGSCDPTPKHIVTQPAVIDSVWVEQKQTGTPPHFTENLWHVRAKGHWVISHTPRSVGDTIVFYHYK
jgi:hypothetical protein